MATRKQQADVTVSGSARNPFERWRVTYDSLVRTLLVVLTCLVASGCTKKSSTESVAKRSERLHVTSGLVAAYDFDEGSGTTVADASGTGNTGTLSGPSWFATGRRGGALSFDGVNDRVTIPDANSLDLTSGMTLMAWVKPDADQTDWGTVVMKERGASGLSYALYATDGNGTPVAYLRRGTQDRTVTGDHHSPRADRWTHLAATYNGSAFRFYVNGKLQNSTSVSGSITTSTGVLDIGGNAPFGEWFHGLIDEVRVYNRGLSESEVTLEMDGVSPGPAPALVAAYGFDEGAGTAAGDTSGTSNTGALSGPTWSASGKHGGALQFDGQDDRVIVADSPSLDVRYGMTLSAWVKPTALSDWRTILLKEHQDFDLGYSLYAANTTGNPIAYINHDGAGVSVQAPSSLPLDTWSHVAATYNDLELNLYVDGQLAASQNHDGDILATDGALSIGGNAVWGEWFEGLIDDVRIYNNGLTAAQITADMNTAVGGGSGCGTGCDDGNPCNGVETCVNGSCVAGTPITCTASDQCHDAGTCNTSTGVCSNPAKTNGTSCNDANACTQTDTCQSGTCTGANPVTCAASDQCHNAGTCNTTTGVCSNPAKTNGTACNDTNACTQSDTCQTGTCTGANPVTCTAQDSCHDVGTCNTSTGACSNPAKTNGTACNDATLCNGSETCQSGSCTSGTPPTISDGNPCTSDICDPIAGVSHTPVATGTTCTNGNACDGAETCNASATCVAGTPPTTNDGNPCTSDACDPVSGVTHMPVATGTLCLDANVCNGAETCNSTGTCVAGTPPTVDDGNVCTADSCDQTSGVSHTPVATGTSCSDANACNGAEACNGAGTCVAGTPAATDDGNPCTADSCDAVNGITHTPVVTGTTCPDGNLCNGLETCDGSGTCASGIPLILDDANSCTSDACDPAVGVEHEAVANGTPCLDSTVCNGEETCNAGTCSPGVPLTVDDGNQCTADTCDPANGVAHAPLPGCDQMPSVVGARLETRASIVGRVEDELGAPVNDFTVKIFDAPALEPHDEDPRADATTTSAADGSFRTRLTSFPQAAAPGTPPHRVLVFVEGPEFIRMSREAYLRPGDLVDLGAFVVLRRDPAVTFINSMGGVATDSQNLVELSFPPGAVLGTVPVRITPVINREQFPVRLPDATATMYGVVLEPDGAEFMLPVTVRLANYRNVPTGLEIPHGVAEEATGRWLHEGFAVWDGERFRGTVTHFSSPDWNSPPIGELVIHQRAWADPNKKGEVACGVGSDVSLASGSLRQTIPLPSYSRQGRDYGVTLTYDSGLTSSRRSQATSAPAQALRPSSFGVLIEGSSFRSECAYGGIRIGGGCGTGIPCLAGGVTGPFQFFQRGLGTQSKVEGTSQGGSEAFGQGGYVDLPLNDDGTAPAPSYGLFEQTVRLMVTFTNAQGACLGGGMTFGVANSTQTPAPSSVPSGPQFRSSEYRLVYHRRGAAVGNGWGVAEVNELFVSPDRSQVDLVSGDGHHEVFRVRPRSTVVALGGQTFPDGSHDPLGSEGLGMAYDFQTGEAFVLDQQFNGPGQLEIFSVTPEGVQSFLRNLPIPSVNEPGNGAARRLAIAHTSAGRVFAIANATGLYAVAESGAVTQLAARTGSVFDRLERPSVAAHGPLVYYTTGLDDLVRRIDLEAPTPGLEPITAATGDIAIDPVALAGGTQLQGAQGVATRTNGSLLVASGERHVVYELLADASGRVGPESPVRRVLGDGGSTTVPRVGIKQPALTMNLRAPSEVSVAPDDSVVVLSSVGIAAYDPGESTARLIIDGISTRNRDFPLIDLNLVGEPQALGAASFLLKFIGGLVRIDYDFLASEDDATRTVKLTESGVTLTDTSADLVESYAFFDAFKGQARLVNRSGRSGEPLLAVTYDTSNRLSRLQDPTGGGYQFSYDGAGRISRIADGTGRSTSLNVDGEGNLRSVSLPAGGTWDFTYEFTRMMTATNPRHGQSHYTYRNDGTLETSKKPEGATTTVQASLGEASYDENGKLIYVGSMTDGHGVTKTVTTNANGNIVRIQSAPDGVQQDLRVTFDDVLRNPVQYANRANSMFRVQAAHLNGVQLFGTRHHDDQGRLIEIFGDSTSSSQYRFDYGTDDRVAIISSRNRNVRENFQYGADGRLSREFDTILGFGDPQPTGREALYSWRADGQSANATTHGVQTTFGYDPTTGQRTSRSDMTGSATFAYDAKGNVTAVNDGVTSATVAYDARNRPIEIRDALNNVTRFGYDDPGCNCSGDLVTEIHTPDLPPDRSWQFDYDSEGRLVGMTDPLEQTAAVFYTPTGEIESAIDPLGRETSMTYDQQGRHTMVVDSEGRVSVFAYPTPVNGAWAGAALVAASPNGVPAPTSLTVPLGPGQYQIGYNGYRSMGRPPEIELYRDATFELSFQRRFDAAMTGEMISRMDRVGLPIDSLQAPGLDRLFTREVYQYDNRFASRFLTFSAATISDIQWTNSVLRNVHAEPTATDAQSDTDRVQYSFGQDAAGRPTNWHMGSSRPGLDQNGSSISLVASLHGGVRYDPVTGYVTSHTSTSATRDISYDQRGLVREASLSFRRDYNDLIYQDHTIIDEGRFQYEYDKVGRNTRLEFPDGHVRIQVWDVLGRLTSRCYNYAPPDPSRCYAATYDAVGNPQVLTDPEGRTEVDYDDLDRVIEVRRFQDGALVETETYAYNALGGFSVYDGLALDDQRPRLGGGGTAPSAVPAAISSGTIEIDGGGRVTRIGPSALTYDNRGRLRTLFSTANGGKRFVYDASGRRSIKVVGGGSVEYLAWNGDNPAGTRDTDSPFPPPPLPPGTPPQGVPEVQRAFVYDGIDHPLWMVDRKLFEGNPFVYEGASIYFELDILGNVRRLRGGLKVSDRASFGSDLGGYRYSAFGKQRPPTATTPLPNVGGHPYSQPIRWQGRWAEDDAATIYDFRSRFWSTELGAFLQPDAFQYLGRTGTLWSWPGQNPFRWRDPYGQGIDEFMSGEEAGFLFDWDKNTDAVNFLRDTSFGDFAKGDYASGVLNYAAAVGVNFFGILYSNPVQNTLAIAPFARGAKGCPGRGPKGGLRPPPHERIVQERLSRRAEHRENRSRDDPGRARSGEGFRDTESANTGPRGDRPRGDTSRNRERNIGIDEEHSMKPKGSGIFGSRRQ